MIETEFVPAFDIGSVIFMPGMAKFDRDLAVLRNRHQTRRLKGGPATVHPDLGALLFGDHHAQRIFFFKTQKFFESPEQNHISSFPKTGRGSNTL